MNSTSFFVLICVGVLFSTSLSHAEQVAEHLILPRDLHEVARSQDCAQITGFYDRIGMVEPPYVYGVDGGEFEWSAAFWCRRAERVWALMFATIGNTGMEYAGEIRTMNAPRGLSILDDAESVPSEWLLSVETEHFPIPQTTLPLDKRFEGQGVISSFDGFSEIFINRGGIWYVYYLH